MERGIPALAAPASTLNVIMCSKVLLTAVHKDSSVCHATFGAWTSHYMEAGIIPRYATHPKKPSDAPTDSGPTSSAPQSPMSICGPYKKKPIMKTVAHCSHGRFAGHDQKANSIAATPTVYPITTCTTHTYLHLSL